MLFDLPFDVLRLILCVFLLPQERIVLRFVNKRLWKLDVLSKDKGKKYLADASTLATSKGHLALLMWIALKLPQDQYRLSCWARGLWAHAAQDGRVEVLKWLRENRWFDGTNSLIVAEIAAERGYMNVLKWLFQVGCVFTANVCAKAAKGNQLEVLKWLHLSKCPWDKHTTRGAAKCGNLEMLKWIISKGCECETGACRRAAKRGDLPMLEFLKYIDITFMTRVIDKAAKRGQLKAVQWLTQNGCPWDKHNCCYTAAEGGHVETLEWFLTNGCRLNDSAIRQAASHGHLDMLKWMRAHGYDVSHAAADSGDSAIQKWIAENTL